VHCGVVASAERHEVLDAVIVDSTDVMDLQRDDLAADGAPAVLPA
jgi:hypothetical protein